MRASVTATAISILIFAALLLALGGLNITRGLRGDYESPTIYLTFGLAVTAAGLLLGAAGAAMAWAARRGNRV